MDLGIVQTAKLTVIYAVVLYWIVTRQFNVTNVWCAEIVQNSSCTRICPKCDFFIFFRFFLWWPVKLGNQNRFDPLLKEKNKNNFASGLKFVSMNINSIRGKNFNCWPSLNFTNLMLWLFKKQKMTAPLQLQNGFWKLANTAYTEKTGIFMVTCSQGYPTRICPSQTEVENNSESVCVNVFVNETSHYVASWYRQPNFTSEDFQLFRGQLDHIRNQHKAKKYLFFR